MSHKQQAKQKIRQLFKLLVAAICGLLPFSTAVYATMDPAYCHSPHTVQGAVQYEPNIMILLDNSGSMQEEAYAQNIFDNTRLYYGLFQSDKCYQYNTGGQYFITTGSSATDTNLAYQCNEATNGGFAFSGNFLNWMTSTRWDVAQRVLTGGRWAGIYIRPLANDRMDDFWYCLDPSPYTDLPVGAGVWFDSFVSGGNRFMYLRRLTACGVANQGENSRTGTCPSSWGGHVIDCSGSGSFLNNREVKIYTPFEPQGVLQENAAKARWGLAIFDDDGSADQGGEIVSYIGTSVGSIVTQIRNMVPLSWTPSAESLLTVVRYFAGEPTRLFETDEYVSPIIGVNGVDPYVRVVNGSPKRLWCLESHVIFITDGQPTQDLGIPATWAGVQADLNGQPLADADADGRDPTNAYNSAGQVIWPNASYSFNDAWPPDNHLDWPMPYANGAWPNNASEYLDDIAFFARTKDIRSDNGGAAGDMDDPDGPIQTVQTHTIFAFGAEAVGRYVLWNTAINGSFEDINGNNKPDLKDEWDTPHDNDDDPDSFFLPENGDEIENAIRNTISRIVSKAASGTSLAIVSESGEGEAAIVQAYYLSEYADPYGQKITWGGFMRALWLDRFGNLREDTIQDGRLVLAHDRIVRFAYDATAATDIPNYTGTAAYLYDDLDGNGLPDASLATHITFPTSIKPIYEAGSKLFQRAPGTRKILTNIGDVSSYGSGSANLQDFVTSNGLLKKNLDADSLDDHFVTAPTQVDAVINYVRGSDQSGYRSRTITLNGTTAVWKLGDMTYSSPRIVAEPQQRFDLIVGEKNAPGYFRYYQQYADRPQVVITGGNDGMVHAFFQGKFVDDDDPGTTPIEEARFQPWTDPNGVTYYPGDEMWAFIPRAALPHLKWLRETNYCHTYFVDGTPQIRDMRIFADDAVHPDGWGTVLMFTMRLGCRQIGSGAEFSAPTFVVMDITQIHNPILLLEYNHTDMEQVIAAPQVAVVRNTLTCAGLGCERWFVLIMGGPNDEDATYSVKRTKAPIMFVIELANGTVVGTTPIMFGSTAATSIDNSHLRQEYFNTPIVADLSVPLDFSSDAIYFTSTVTSSSYDGYIYRIALLDASGNPIPNPANWRAEAIYSSLGVGANGSFNTQPMLYTPQGPNGPRYVLAGTGRLYNLSDASLNEQERILLFRDDCPLGPNDCTIKTTASLTNVSGCLFNKSTGDGTLIDLGIGSQTCAFGNISNVKTAVEASGGWYMNFPAARERYLGGASIRGSLLHFCSAIPSDDPCKPETQGRCWLLDVALGINEEAPVLYPQFGAGGGAGGLGGGIGGATLGFDLFSGPVRGAHFVTNPLRLWR